MIAVRSFGARKPHAPHHVFSIPQGLGLWLAMVFHTGVEIETRDGRVQGRPGQGIVLAPDFPQYHRGDADGYINDWINLAGDDVGEAVRRYRIPVNRMLDLDDPAAMGRLLAEMHGERVHAATGWEEALDLLARRLLLSFARHRRSGAGAAASVAPRHRASLLRIRTRMLKDVARPWSVPALAVAAGLGEHRFATLYRRCFGTPPLEDLIRARIEEARWLLARSDDPIADIAERCGFRDLPYFTRQFARRVGCPPGRWRRDARTGG